MQPTAKSFLWGAALLFAGTGATTASADALSYHGAMCSADPDADFYVNFEGLHANEGLSAVCPFLRTDDCKTLPSVYVETEQNSSSDDDLECTLLWLQEDGTGWLQGMSNTRSTGSTGYRQISFSTWDHYSNPWVNPQTSGGEGTMSLSCSLEQYDRIIQYRVSECNVYDPAAATDPDVFDLWF